MKNDWYSLKKKDENSLEPRVLCVKFDWFTRKHVKFCYLISVVPIISIKKEITNDLNKLLRVRCGRNWSSGLGGEYNEFENIFWFFYHFLVVKRCCPSFEKKTWHPFKIQTARRPERQTNKQTENLRSEKPNWAFWWDELR